MTDDNPPSVRPGWHRLTPQQQKLCAENLARLEVQRTHGNERPKRRDVSILDLTGNTCLVESAAAISRRRFYLKGPFRP